MRFVVMQGMPGDPIFTVFAKKHVIRTHDIFFQGSTCRDHLKSRTGFKIIAYYSIAAGSSVCLRKMIQIITRPAGKRINFAVPRVHDHDARGKRIIFFQVSLQNILNNMLYNLIDSKHEVISVNSRNVFILKGRKHSLLGIAQ